MVNQDRVLERFLEYISIDSESYSEGEFQKHLKKDLEDLGLEVVEDNIGEKIGSDANNLIVKLPGSTDKTLLFSAHMDTVVPGKGIKASIEDGVIRSDGTTILGSDDKAGIAAIVEMLTVLKEENAEHHNIEVVFTVAEETGLLGSKYLDYDLIDPDMGFVLDSGGTPGHIIVQAPAQTLINFTFNGRSAHAGLEPETGVSAIMTAADAITHMNLLRIDEETTANVGIIKGGEATNIVTDKVVVEAEARSLDEEKLKKQVDHMIYEAKAAGERAGMDTDVEVIESYKPFLVEDDAEPVEMSRAAAEKLGLDFSTGSTGGGSDTNNFNLKGIPSVNMAVGMTGAHTLDEHIKVEDMVNAARFIVEIARV